MNWEQMVLGWGLGFAMGAGLLYGWGQAKRIQAYRQGLMDAIEKISDGTYLDLYLKGRKERYDKLQAELTQKASLSQLEEFLEKNIRRRKDEES